MIIRPFVLIYEHIASHITDERDDVAEDPGWIQSQDLDPVLRPEFYLSRTDFVESYGF